MSTFKYHIAPKANGGFTTRIDLADPVVPADFLAELATETGLTAEQLTTAITGFGQKILACANGCVWSPDFLGLFTFRPSSGGSQTDPGGFDTVEEINANVSLAFTAQAIATWRATLSMESTGHVGLATPVIATIVSEENGGENQYTPGALIRLRGERLRFDKADTAQGIFFTEAGQPETRATIYGPIDPTEVVVLVPATISGLLNVRIAAFVNSSIRSYTYTSPIAQSA